LCYHLEKQITFLYFKSAGSELIYN